MHLAEAPNHNVHAVEMKSVINDYGSVSATAIAFSSIAAALNAAAMSTM